MRAYLWIVDMLEFEGNVTAKQHNRNEVSSFRATELFQPMSVSYQAMKKEPN